MQRRFTWAVRWIIKKKRKRGRKGRVAAVQSIIGLGILGSAYHMSQSIESPVKALFILLLSSIIGSHCDSLTFYSMLADCASIHPWQNNMKLSVNQRTLFDFQTYNSAARKMGQGLASVYPFHNGTSVTMATTALQRGTTARLDSNYPTDYSAVAYFVQKRIWINILQRSKIKEQMKGQLKDEKMIFLNVQFSFRATENGSDLRMWTQEIVLQRCSILVSVTNIHMLGRTTTVTEGNDCRPY